MTAVTDTFWRKCSSCKKEIGFNKNYFICSVSTCNGQRTGYVFCSVQCFETHLPGARHRDAAAVEKRSPGSGGGEQRTLVRPQSVSGIAVSGKILPKDVLIIASRLKEYIHARAEMNTSAAVLDVLSDRVRKLCDDAIDKAKAEGRKTVMERDFEN